MYGSYGVNAWLSKYDPIKLVGPPQWFWETADARNPAKVPVWFDCAEHFSRVGMTIPPYVMPPNRLRIFLLSRYTRELGVYSIGMMEG